MITPKAVSSRSNVGLQAGNATHRDKLTQRGVFLYTERNNLVNYICRIHKRGHTIKNVLKNVFNKVYEMFPDSKTQKLFFKGNFSPGNKEPNISYCLCKYDNFAYLILYCVYQYMLFAICK